MKEFTIPIECTEGYLPVAFREVKLKESYVSQAGCVFTCDSQNETDGPRLIVEKIKPVERTFRLVSESRHPSPGDYVSYDIGSILLCNMDGWAKGQVWEEVTDEP